MPDPADLIPPGGVYLDHNATTPLDPRVVDAMLPYLRDRHGNPSSSHPWGRQARAAVDRARVQAADLLGVHPDEIVFTSGGTEANNHAIIGVVGGTRVEAGTCHIVTSAVEHPAISEVCRHLAAGGVAVTKVPVDDAGRVDPAAVAAALRPETVLVTIMHANNEVGTIQPVAAVAQAARERGVLVHTDAAQSVGKIPVDRQELGADLISVAGHKLYAPAGVGILCVRRGVRLTNLMHGAAHEGGRRPGTENVASIVGLGVACSIAAEYLTTEMERLSGLRDRLEADLLARFPTARVHGLAAARLPNTLSIGFADVTADAILAHLPDVAVSAGAACHADGVRISHVLQAMSVPDRFARGTLRISLGRTTTDTDVTRGLAALVAAVEQAADVVG